MRMQTMPGALLFGALLAAAGADPALGGDGAGIRLLDSPPVRLATDRTPVLRAGVGAFDPLEIGGSKHRPGTTFAGHVSIRPGLRWLVVAPSVGLYANADGGFFGYVGASFDLDVGWLRFTPTLGLGAYEEGDGKDLGGVFEFLVAGSLTVPVAGGWRAGIAYDHLSNSRVHRDNPGTEMILGIAEVAF